MSTYDELSNSESVTYEEFLNMKKINDDKLKVLGIGINSSFCNASINENDDVLKYLDVAKKAKNLKSVMLNPYQNKKSLEEARVFIQNCKDNISISNELLIGDASKEEFLQAEEIIDKVLSQVNSEWSTKQKLAFTHYQMAELVSYLPDINSQNQCEHGIGYPQCIGDARNIWKSLVTEKSVCNGIVAIQRTILSRLGIETEALNSRSHTFLLTKTEEGNILTDPTWDLKWCLYGFKPQFFGVSYENLKKADGEFSHAHQLKVPPENVLEIGNEELRDLYQSLGIVNKDRKFEKGTELLYKLKAIKQNTSSSIEEKMDQTFEIFQEKDYKDKLDHIDEFNCMLRVFLSTAGVDVNNLEYVQQYVYSKSDTEFLKPKLLSSIVLEDGERKTYLIDPENKDLRKIGLEELNEEYQYHKNNKIELFWKKELEQSEEQKNKGISAKATQTPEEK